MKIFTLVILLFFSQFTCAKKTETQDIVYLNQATKNELMSLNGIGEKKAELIIQYRNQHHHFDQIEELEKIQGIGPKLIQKNLRRLAL